MTKFCINCGYDLSSVVKRVSGDTPAETQKQSRVQDIDEDIESRIVRKVVIKKKATPQQLEHLAKAREARKINLQAKKLINKKQQETSEEPPVKPAPKKKVIKSEPEPEIQNISDEEILPPQPPQPSFVPLF